MPPTILLVEDDAPIRNFLAEALSDEGYHVRAVADVASARAAIADQEPDLLLTDLWLQENSGLAFARELRQTGITIPIALMTAEPNARSFDLSDISFCLLKPFDLEVLLDCVASHLQCRMG